MLAELIRERFFALEWTSTSLDMESLERFCVERGARSVATVRMISGPEATSFAFRESQQQLVRVLPTGSRTLLLRDAAILLRGANKFSDMPQRWRCSLGDAFGRGLRVAAQRKLAGFVVHYFSLDGSSIEVATKHSTEGSHATWAREIWRATLPSESSVAATLFQRRLVLCCECIDLENDRGHPVVEPEVSGKRRLACFSVQRRDTLQELALPAHESRALCDQWCIPFVPCCDVRGIDDIAALEATMCEWDGAFLGDPVCEGVVIVVEVPLQFVCGAMKAPSAVAEALEALGGSALVVPLRLKLKAERYKILRALRSRVLGESLSLSSGNAFAVHPLHELFVAWCYHVSRWSPDDLEAKVRSAGIEEVFSEFARYCQRKRPRGVGDLAEELSGKGDYTHLIRWVSAIGRRRTLISEQPHVVLMLCGLPGSGKSTACRALEALTEGSPFRWMFTVSRDATAKRLTLQLGASDLPASKHAQRRLRRAVHGAVLDQVALACAAATWTDGPCLVVLDACHAEQRTREFWFAQFPPAMKRLIAYFHCTDAASRAEQRVEHEVLEGECAAVERATFAVARRFTPPTSSSDVLDVDTGALDAQQACQQLQHFLGWRRALDQETMKVLDAAELQEKFFLPQIEDMAQGILGVSVVCGSFWLDWKKKASACRAATACIVLDEEWGKSLRAFVVSSLAAALEPPAPPPAGVLSRIVRSVFPSGPASSVLNGHVAWVRGLVASRRYRSQCAEATVEAMLEAELDSRFQQQDHLHVTLRYAVGLGAKDACLDWLLAQGLREGDCMTVTVSGFVISFDCISCKVAALAGPASCHTTPRASTNAFDDEEYPLHVTLGCAPGADALRGALLLQAVQTMQMENERCSLEKVQRKTLAAQREGVGIPAGTTRRMHNFVEIRFAAPLVLKGRVAIR
jgi:hypothetical protein